MQVEMQQSVIFYRNVEEQLTISLLKRLSIYNIEVFWQNCKIFFLIFQSWAGNSLNISSYFLQPSLTLKYCSCCQHCKPEDLSFKSFISMSIAFVLQNHSSMSISTLSSLQHSEQIEILNIVHILYSNASQAQNVSEIFSLLS